MGMTGRMGFPGISRRPAQEGLRKASEAAGLENGPVLAGVLPAVWPAAGESRADPVPREAWATAAAGATAAERGRPHPLQGESPPSESPLP